MKFVEPLIRGKFAPLVAAVVGLVYLTALGFRGVGESTIDWLEDSRQLAEDFTESPSVALDWTHESVALLELFGAFFYTLVPGGYTEWVLFSVSLVAGAVSTGLVFLLGRRLAGPLGGWLSLFFLLTCGPWMGLFTRLDPTFVLVPFIGGFLAVWYAETLRWWHRVLAGTPLLATAILLWPGTVVVLALLLVTELLCPVTGQSTDRPGVVDGPDIDIDRLLIPLATGLLLLAYPLFWPGPVDNLVAFFLATMEGAPAEFVFRGDAYPPARPPLYTGGAWIFEQLPLAVVGAVIAGILWCFGGMRGDDRRPAVGCAAVATALLTLPVIFRDPRPMGAEFGVLFVATAIPVASLVTCRFFSHALGRSAPSKKVRQVAIGAFLLAGASILLEAPRAVESPESFRSPMSARVTGWSASGDMPMREQILPLRLIEASGADRNTRLYRGDWERHLDVYERMRLLRDVATTGDPDRADVSIRPVPPIAAGPFNVHPATHRPPVEGTETEVVPDIHRPLFFIDRRR